MGAVVPLEPLLAAHAHAEEVAPDAGGGATDADGELATVLDFSRASAQRLHPALGRAAAARALEREADHLHGNV